MRDEEKYIKKDDIKEFNDIISRTVIQIFYLMV